MISLPSNSNMDNSSIAAAGTATQQQHSLTYLSNFPHKTRTPTLGNAASLSTYVRSDHDQVDDSELSIFDAKKYYSNDCSSTNKEEANATNKQRLPSHHHVINLQPPRLSSASSLDGHGRTYRARSFNATPTASSEASWNSKTGLLSNPPGAIPVSMRNPDYPEHEKKKSSKWLFGRKCPCSGKKSVQVEDNHKLSEPKTLPHLYNNNQTQKMYALQEKQNWIPQRISTTTTCTGNGFSSLGQRVYTDGTATTTTTTTTSTTAFAFPVLKLNAPLPPHEADPPRESLEIFQPSDSSTKSSLEQLQQHRMLLARQSFAFPASPPKARMTITDVDDVASDASSDLFEIESLSTQTIRDSLDEASSFNARRLGGGGGGGGGGNLYCGRSMEEVTPSSIACIEGGYEPSEASIDWSVTTAEGFDKRSVTNFSSVTAHEIDEMMMGHEKKKNKQASGVGGGGRSSQGLLLSCRCEKAVSVGPNPVKCGADESATKHVNCRSSKPPLAGSRSSRLSIPFAT